MSPVLLNDENLESLGGVGVSGSLLVSVGAVGVAAVVVVVEELLSLLGTVLPILVVDQDWIWRSLSPG